MLSCEINPLYRYDEPEEVLFFKLINRSQSIEFDPESVSVSLPEPTNNRQTAVVVAPTQYSPLSSQMTLHYGRIDIGRFFYGIPLIFPEPDTITPEWLSNTLLERWAVLIEADKLELTIFRSVPRHPRKAVLRIKDTSLIWIGELELWLLPDGVLGEAFSTFVNPLSFNIRQKRLNAYLYSHDKALVDLPTSVFTYLSSIESLHTLDVESTVFLNTLSDKTGDPWTIQEESCPFNLYYARICYVGPFWFPEHTDSHCLVLELNEACTNLFGYLVLYARMPVLSEILTVTTLSGYRRYLTEHTLNGFQL